MADEDLSILDETKPDGDTEEVSVLDEYQRETRTKLKAWAGIEHDLETGAHVISHGGLPGGSSDGRLLYHDAQRELLIDYGGVFNSVAQPTYNYVINGMFNQFYTLPTPTFVGWNISGTTANLLQTTGGIYGVNAARIRAVVDYAVLGQYIAKSASPLAPFNPITYWQGKTVTFGAMVRASVASTTYLRIWDGLTFSGSAYHPGDNLWHWITVTKIINGAATALEVEFVSTALGVNAFVSGATLVEGHSCLHPLPPSWQGRQGVLRFGHSDIQPNTNTPWWYGAGGHALSNIVKNYVPFDALVKNFQIHMCAGMGVGVLTAQVDYNGTLTPLSITTTGASPTASDLVNTYMGARGGGWSVKVARNSGTANGFFASLTYDEVPAMP